MRARWAVVLLCLSVLPIRTHGTQRPATTAVSVTVAPEARVTPSQVTLRFRISADGSSDLTAQNATIAGAVRAIPGQAIHLTAQLTGIQGPNGTISAQSIVWSAQSVQSSGGGRQAACIRGIFSGSVQDLAVGWAASGALQCLVTFELLNPRSLMPGDYRGTVAFGIGAN